MNEMIIIFVVSFPTCVSLCNVFDQFAVDAKHLFVTVATSLFLSLDTIT